MRINIILYPSTALLSDLNILPFQERVAKLKAKMVCEVLDGLLPRYTAERFFKIQRSLLQGNKKQRSYIGSSQCCKFVEQSS